MDIRKTGSHPSPLAPGPDTPIETKSRPATPLAPATTDTSPSGDSSPAARWDESPLSGRSPPAGDREGWDSPPPADWMEGELPAEWPPESPTVAPSGGASGPARADTPLTRHLADADRKDAAPRGPRESPISPGAPIQDELYDIEEVWWSLVEPDTAQPLTVDDAPAGPRRLVVDAKAEVPDPRIRHLPDGATPPDGQHAGRRMPPARVNGESPDTGYRASDPVWTAIRQAMQFAGATAGLSQGQAMGPDLRSQGFNAMNPATEAALNAAAHDAIRALLVRQGYPDIRAAR